MSPKNPKAATDALAGIERAWLELRQQQVPFVSPAAPRTGADMIAHAALVARWEATVEMGVDLGSAGGVLVGHESSPSSRKVRSRPRILCSRYASVERGMPSRRAACR